ncbi:MAG: hypothetical protein ACSLEZ_15095 [Thiobacillus sp.]
MSRSDCAECGKCVLANATKKGHTVFRVPVDEGQLLLCSSACLWDAAFKRGKRAGLQQAKEFAEAMLVTA